jgi:excisionase family DNA binding protein
MNMSDLPELLTLQQAAQLINVHPNTLRNWEKEGKISVIRIGSRRDRRFPKAGILAIFQGAATTSTVLQPAR